MNEKQIAAMRDETVAYIEASIMKGERMNHSFAPTSCITSMAFLRW